MTVVLLALAAAFATVVAATPLLKRLAIGYELVARPTDKPCVFCTTFLASPSP